MCLVVLNWEPGADVPLVLVANRDEFRARPTETMHWWSDQAIPMLAGRDLQAGGTWFAVDRASNFALITNIRPGYVGKAAGLSRGALPTRFIQTGADTRRFHQELLPQIDEYGGFNLLLGNREQLFWFSSDHPEGRWLEPGVHALSNDALDTPWPKVGLAKQQMHDSVRLLKAVPAEWESLLSAQTILGKEYGTRARTWLRLYQNNRISVTEAQYSPEGERNSLQQFNWVEF